MQRHHIGSGRRKVLPADWSAHHRPLLAGTRGATVTLRRPGGTPGAFDPDTGTYPSTPHPAYFTGLARVQVLTASEQRERMVAEQQVTTLGYAVMLNDTVNGMQLTDVCTVTAVDDNGDQWLIGRELVVRSIESGSLLWERRLLCADNLETQEA